MSAYTAKRPRLLFLAKSSPSLVAVLSRFKAASLDVTLAFTRDSAVALCLGNQFAVVLLDAALIRNDDWTVAKSLKLLKPTVPIVLLDRRRVGRRDTLPANAEIRCLQTLMSLRRVIIQTMF